MTFREIERFTGDGNYTINVGIDYLKATVDGYIKDFGLELNPDFQRGHVWTKKQQISYLEFFYRGGKSANVIYFNCPSFGRGEAEDSDIKQMVLVDGLQRLTSHLDFLDNKIPIFGYYFKEFTDRPRLTQYDLRFNINDLQYRHEVLKWYIEMNTGGVVHTKEEIERVQKLLEASMKK